MEKSRVVMIGSTTTGFIGCNTAEAAEKASMSSSSNDIDACFEPGGVDTNEPKLEPAPKDDDNPTKLPVPAANENVESNVCETSLRNANARF
jgi:hypothetical protein